MTRRIGDEEVQLRDRVLQVVHHERRQAIVRFELAALGELAIGFVLRQVGRDMLSDRA